MALKEKKGQQHRGARAFRRPALGKRRPTGLVVLGGLVVALALLGVVGSAYLGATPIGTALQVSFLDNEEASMERVVNPAVAAEAPEPVSEEAATREQAAEEAQSEAAALEAAAAAEELAAQQAAAVAAVEELVAQEAAAVAAWAARLEAEQIAAQDAAVVATAEAARLEAEQIAAQEEQAAAQAALEDELAAQQPALDEELPTERGLPESESAPVAPSDPTMYLDIPKLGISGAIVAGGEAGLEMGTQLVSGAPWLAGSNTYIAGHRIGFPGTGSDRIFYDLPSMTAGDLVSLTDSNGEVYTYQVSEVFAVTPFDVWVTAPTGSDMVTLQVCTETPEDWMTIGPKLMESGPESGRLIVRAVRV